MFSTKLYENVTYQIPSFLNRTVIQVKMYLSHLILVKLIAIANIANIFVYNDVNKLNLVSDDVNLKPITLFINFIY